MKFWKKFIGDADFYKMLLRVALPIMIQNGITNSVNLLDNIMVGQTGTEAMSGVAVVNTLIFVFEITIFGVIAGASIFGAQYYGKGDDEGFCSCFRFKIIYGAAALVIGLLIFGFGGSRLISLYLHENGGGGVVDPAAAHAYGLQYLHIIMISLPAFVAVQAYAGSLREMGETMLPMYAGVAAIVVNVCLNYVLIFGKFGFPRMGVAGAAAATVIARFAEALIVIIAVHVKHAKYAFIENAYRHFRVPLELQKRIFIKGSPLMLNELLWSAGMAALNQAYSMRGMEVVASINISATIANVFNIVFIALGMAVSIIIGQLLGAGEMERAKDTDTKLIASAVIGCTFVGVIMIVCAPFIPRIYKTTDAVRETAAFFIMVQAVLMPARGFLNTCYFTLRSGGKTIITFFFDSVYIWCVSIPFARFLVGADMISIREMYMLVEGTDLIKCVVGFILLRRGVWLQNIVQDRNE
ncbi:MAG: MATE family efflux transporter [Lachnospiraceae bacterium]|nr:MATE family efflux transporter [Lachnospiraceae bacterium]